MAKNNHQEIKEAPASDELQKLQVLHYTQMQNFTNTSSRVIATEASLAALQAELDRLKGLQILQHADLLDTEKRIQTFPVAGSGEKSS